MLLAAVSTTPSTCARSSIAPLLARALVVVAAPKPARGRLSPTLSPPPPPPPPRSSCCCSSPSSRGRRLAMAAAADDDLDALYGAEEAVAEAPPAAAAAAAAAPAAPPPPPPAAAAAPPPPAKTNPNPHGRAPPTLLPAKNTPFPTDLRAAFSNAVVLVDKPPGWSSFDVCHALKRPLKALGISKVGHAGTLDPMATGLLVVCTGQATKSIESFMGRDKRYTATLRLGQATPSQDAETAVSEERAWEHVTDTALREIAATRLTGDGVMQRPPIYSALHAGGGTGKRLYELAREGGEAAKRAEEARPARPVRVASFVLEPRRPDAASLSPEESERLDREQREAMELRAAMAAEAEASDAERVAQREQRGGGRTPSPPTSEEGQEEQQQQPQQGGGEGAGGGEGEGAGGGNAASAPPPQKFVSGRMRRRDRAEQMPPIPYDPRRDVRFECVVSKGTYVRTLGADLAELAGTAGHLTALRRTAVGDDLLVADAWDVRELVARMREGLKAMGIEEKEPVPRLGGGGGRGRRRGKGRGGGGGGGEGSKRARVGA
jgi:tRNA pseudouridine(55) synthase